MAKAKKVSLVAVPAARIREAARNGEFEVPEAGKASVFGKNGNPRGRLHPSVIEAAASIGLTYVEKANEGKTITLPVTKTSAKGAVLKRPVDVSLKEFRRLSGTSAGRPSQSALQAAAAAYMAENA